MTHYRPPSNLPDPTPEDGYEFRWVRTAMLGDADNRNVSMRYREGWEPCLAEDHPELMIMSDVNSTYEGNVVIGGLMLCKCSTEKMEARNKYFAEQANQQALSVDHNFMRENDPRMPLFNFAIGARQWRQQPHLTVLSQLTDLADITMDHIANSKSRTPTAPPFSSEMLLRSWRLEL